MSNGKVGFLGDPSIKELGPKADAATSVSKNEKVIKCTDNKSSEIFKSSLTPSNLGPCVKTRSHSKKLTNPTSELRDDFMKLSLSTPEIDSGSTQRPNSARTRSVQRVKSTDVDNVRPKSAGNLRRNVYTDPETQAFQLESEKNSRQQRHTKKNFSSPNFTAQTEDLATSCSFELGTAQKPAQNGLRLKNQIDHRQTNQAGQNPACQRTSNFRQRWGKPFKGRRKSSSKTEDDTGSKPRTSSASKPRTPSASSISASRPNLRSSDKRRRYRSTKLDSEQYSPGNLDEILDPILKVFNKNLSTALVYDERMLLHKSPIYDFHVERPERLTSIYDKLCSEGLVSKCLSVHAREITKAEILTFHDEVLLEKLISSRGSDDVGGLLKNLTSSHDDVYFNNFTCDAALLAAGGCLELVETIMTGKAKNGFALVRPPGHHAMQSNFCGFSFLNNAVLAANHAINSLGCQKVLIVDWDVHHGNGTQDAYYHDSRVLYFSIHRYEYGLYWPHLKESDYDHIGEGDGVGYNVNVPLNKSGLGDADYLHIFLQILLPLAYEFCPDIVIVSCGFDASLGDPLGEMCVTPSCYAQMTHLLSLFAEGRVAILLEGGYFLPTLAESAAATVKSLLGDICPKAQISSPTSPHSVVVDVVHNLKCMLAPYWQCFSDVTLSGSRWFSSVTSEPTKEKPLKRSQKHDIVEFKSYAPLGPDDPPRTFSFESYNPYTKEEESSFLDLLSSSIAKHPTHRVNGTAIVYDSAMKRHKNVNESGHPEKPDRISCIYSELARLGILKRCHHVDSRLATETELCLCHSEKHVGEMRATKTTNGCDLHKLQNTFNSVYLNQASYDCARLSAGCLLNVVDDIMNGRRRNGIAIIRPPGHHAEHHIACGFCLFNNVAVAARYTQAKFGLGDDGAPRRIVIIDWDVHHGNGTQHIFENDPSILYISLHRHDNGAFFPGNDDGNFDKIGSDKGIGYNVNIPWNTNGKRPVGDATYMKAFLDIVIPICAEFNPELVLVSAGFDAAMGDPLGRCQVTPMGFAHMTQMLCGLAEGKVILALEGGYNLKSISECMTACSLALLGCPMPRLALHKKAIHSKDRMSISNVVEALRPYWKMLNTVAVPDSDGDTFLKNYVNDIDANELTDDLADVFESLTIQSTEDICRPMRSVSRTGLDPNLQIQIAALDLKLAEVPAVVSPEVQEEAKRLIRVLVLGEQGAKVLEEASDDSQIINEQVNVPIIPLMASPLQSETADESEKSDIDGSCDIPRMGSLDMTLDSGILETPNETSLMNIDGQRDAH